MSSDNKSREHLANERTFLAWVRTSLGIMAVGFVVVKFSLFLKQLSLLLGKETAQDQSNAYSAILGIVLVSFAGLITLLAFFNFRRIASQIGRESFQPSQRLTTFLMSFIVLLTVLLVIYLLQST